MTVLNIILEVPRIEHIVVISRLISAYNTTKIGSVWSTG